MHSSPGTDIVLAIVLPILIFLALISVIACIAAFFLRISTRIVCGFKPPFWYAWRVTLICWICLLFVEFLRWFVLLSSGTHLSLAMGQLQTLAIDILVPAMILGITLEHPQRGVVGFGRGVLVTIVQAIVGGIVGVCILLAAVLIFGLPKGTPKDMAKLRAAFDQMIQASNAKSPSPAPTPASITTTEEAQKEAIRRYPELAVAGSKLNTAYMARYTRYQRERPGYFMDKLWPISLAEETAESSGSK